MSEEQSPAATGQAGPPKKGVSPARNAIGLIILVVVVIVGVIQYTAMARFNSVLNALNDRMAVEDKDLMTQPEAEAMIGKAPDDAGGDVQIGNATYARKTYTWKALLKSYTLAAYYTRGTTPALHHIESEGAKFEPEPNTPATPPKVSAKTDGGPQQTKPGRARGKGKKAAGAPKDQDKPAADDKAKAGADEQPKAAEPKPDDKAKAGTDEKPKTAEPKPDDKAKAGADEQPKSPE